MLVTLVSIWVKPEHREAFIEETRLNHEGAVAEPGNVRFDVLQSADDPCRFMLYEVYASPEAVAAHKGTEHYRRWRQAVDSWMAQPREGVPFRPLFPREPEAW